MVFQTSFPKVKNLKCVSKVKIIFSDLLLRRVGKPFIPQPVHSICHPLILWQKSNLPMWFHLRQFDILFCVIFYLDHYPKTLIKNINSMVSITFLQGDGHLVIPSVLHS